MPKIPYVAPQPVTKQEVLVGNTERSTQIGLTKRLNSIGGSTWISQMSFL